jgi:hypothetical protein
MKYIKSKGAHYENMSLRNRSKAFLILLLFTLDLRLWSVSALNPEAKRSDLRGKLCTTSNWCCAWC